MVLTESRESTCFSKTIFFKPKAYENLLNYSIGIDWSEKKFKRLGQNYSIILLINSIVHYYLSEN